MNLFKVLLIQALILSTATAAVKGNWKRHVVWEGQHNNVAVAVRKLCSRATQQSKDALGILGALHPPPARVSLACPSHRLCAWSLCCSLA